MPPDCPMPATRHGRAPASTPRKPTRSCTSRQTRAASTFDSEAAVVRERLYRSRSDRMIFGVAGGMADWFDLDPSLVRLVWAAIVIPEEPLGAAAPGPASAESPATAAGAAASAAGPGPIADDWYARRQAR